MKNNSPRTAPRSRSGALRTMLFAGATLVLVVPTMTALMVSPSSAAGTTPNTITLTGPPLAGSVGGSFVTNAVATSKDQVFVAVNPSTSVCSQSGGKVNFTGPGECVVTYNDPGNATYAAAPTVTQNIKVYPDNQIAIASKPTAASVAGVYSPNATATSGDVVILTLATGSTGCSVNAGKVDFTRQGTCRGSFNDPGNGAFAAAKGITYVITVYVNNIIHASQPPFSGAVNATYAASATASSGDAVVITLDPSATGCEITGDLVTFTGNGLCVVDFNDPGNGPFAAAKQIQQKITSGVGGPRAQAVLYLTSLNATLGRAFTLTSSGGSGTGAVSYSATSGTAHCSIKVSANVLSFAKVGTCVVTVTKATDSTYELAYSSPTIVTVNLSKSPHALRVSGTPVAGRTVAATITGTGFYGTPRVVSNQPGTKVVVTSDSGRALSIRVTVAKGTPAGVHTFTLTFAHGQRTLALYTQH